MEQRFDFTLEVSVAIFNDKYNFDVNGVWKLIHRIIVSHFLSPRCLEYSWLTNLKEGFFKQG